MKKIAGYIFCLLLMIFIIDRAFSWLFTRYIFLSTYQGESGGATNYILKNKTYDFLILGSSRARHHIDPKLLNNINGGNGFNAGINGTGGIIYNNLLLRLLIDRGCRPKLIILQLDAYPYFSSADDNPAKEIAALYPFLSQSEMLDSSMQQYLSNADKAKLLLHSYRFNGKILNLLYNHRRSFPKNDFNGFMGLSGVMDSINTKIERPVGQPFEVSATKLSALLDIVQICDTRNIRLAIVMPPSFQNVLHSDEANRVILGSLGKYGQHEIYDFSDVNKLPLLQSSRLWRDPTHLNNEGAKIFTDMLTKELHKQDRSSR